MPEIPFDRRRVLAVGVVALLVLVVAGKVFLRPARPVVPPPVRVSAAASHAPAPMLFVNVVGAVRRPGLYRLKDGARVADAVSRAGGPTPKAQIELVNLAARIADGEQIVVPRRGLASPSATASGGAVAAGPVHLNSATLEQLDALPGVGPVTAQKILDYRQQHGAFGSVDELDAIAGIGPARLEQLRGLVAP
ncbi:MAG TPA: helix-hairpin-helix domain-containing protein [Gaiellaceae bacterium]